ncbi:hypothetical protein [Actinomadura litoris]|uniref:hypothetical protein n=1 Tax=Actinomadura litoris TaxID=2678616 RepID=UPI001FA74858|nr:hypothetical protein [Actinomadura litoris]
MTAQVQSATISLTLPVAAARAIPARLLGHIRAESRIVVAPLTAQSRLEALHRMWMLGRPAASIAWQTMGRRAPGRGVRVRLGQGCWDQVVALLEEGRHVDYQEAMVVIAIEDLWDAIFRRDGIQQDGTTGPEGGV